MYLIIFIQIVVTLYFIKSFLYYEELLKELKDQKMQYKFKHINITEHKQYLLNYIKELRKEEEMTEKKYKINNNKLRYDLMRLVEISENQYEELEKTKKELNILTSYKNKLFVEKEQLSFQLRKLESEKKEKKRKKHVYFRRLKYF